MALCRKIDMLLMACNLLLHIATKKKEEKSERKKIANTIIAAIDFALVWKNSTNTCTQFQRYQSIACSVKDDQHWESMHVPEISYWKTSSEIISTHENRFMFKNRERESLTTCLPNTNGLNVKWTEKNVKW